MAKGQYSKQIIIEKILEEFDGAFVCGDGKELRIPMTEDGTEVQIKVALTCAKENVPHGEDCGAASPKAPDTSVTAVTEPTAEEIQSVQDIMAKLGL